MTSERARTNMLVAAIGTAAVLLGQSSLAIAGGACASDTDCLQYERCALRDDVECPDGSTLACLDGESDDECVSRVEAWQSDNCAQTQDTLCTVRWLLPCETSEDCGAGFTCTAADRQCQALDDSMACVSDSDCPDFWMCVIFGTGESDVDTGVAGRSGGDESMGRCVPPGSLGAGGSLTAAEANDAPDKSTASPDGAEGGGCTVAAATPGRPATVLLLGLLGAAIAAARRSRRSRS
jgi:MYXO-CTERM domain-containing protein